MLIILFVALFVYFVFGGVFLKYRVGATGVDLIPNSAFWTAIPGLVKDGATFLVSKCTKRGEYQTI